MKYIDERRQSVGPPVSPELMRCASSRAFPQQHRLGIAAQREVGERNGCIRKNIVITHDSGELVTSGTSLGQATQKSSSAFGRFGSDFGCLSKSAGKVCADESQEVLLIGHAETSAEHAMVRFLVFWVSPAEWLWPCDGGETERLLCYHLPLLL